MDYNYTQPAQGQFQQQAPQQQMVVLHPSFSHPQQYSGTMPVYSTPYYYVPSQANQFVNPLQNMIFLGTYGYIVALDCTSPLQIPRVVWKKSLEGTGYHPVSIVVYGNYLYAATAGSVFKMNPSDGSILWRTTPVDMTFNWYLLTLLICGEFVLVGGAGYVCCFHALNGALIWTGNLKGTGYNVTTMAVVDNVIYAGSNGAVFAFDFSGKTLWSSDLPGRGYGPLTLNFSSSSNGTPTLYVGGNGYVSAFDLLSRKEIKHVNLCGFTVVGLLMYKGVLYVSNAGEIIALNSSTLQRIWSNNLDGTGYGHGGSVVVVNGPTGDMLIAGNNGYSVGLDPATGKTLWTVSLPGSGYRIVNNFEHNRVIISASNGKLYGLEPGTGKILWKDGLKGLGYGPIMLADVYHTTNTHSDTPIFQEEERVRQSSNSN